MHWLWTLSTQYIDLNLSKKSNYVFSPSLHLDVSNGAKVLVVEDSSSQRKMLIRKLKVADPSWDISSATTGEQLLFVCRDWVVWFSGSMCCLLADIKHIHFTTRFERNFCFWLVWNCALTIINSVSVVYLRRGSSFDAQGCQIPIWPGLCGRKPIRRGWWVVFVVWLVGLGIRKNLISVGKKYESDYLLCLSLSTILAFIFIFPTMCVIYH